jgi:hypothetical protein
VAVLDINYSLAQKIAHGNKGIAVSCDVADEHPHQMPLLWPGKDMVVQEY